MTRSSTHGLHDALLPVTIDWIAQLQAADPSDFGRIALRPTETGERLVTLLWNERAAWPRVSGDSALRYELEETCDRLVRQWVHWAYDRNQFFDMTSARMLALRAAHATLLHATECGLEASSSLEDFAHHAQLSAFCYAERVARVFRSLVVVEGLRGRGAEYSPELQLEVLGLKEHDWSAPIVDLGCGADAQLVAYLSERGLAATGIDRRAVGPHVIAKDWFDVYFEPSSIGTIVSHLAFSLQFLHQHWQKGARAYDYARKYTELLASLSKGGSFCYAPGLPFIESLLDRSVYQVNTIPLPEQLTATLGSLRDIGTGQSIAYACQIRRR